MKRFLLCIVFIAPLLSFAQCPTGSVSLTTQAEVDDFVANFPNCTQIDGNLRIGNNFISGTTPPMDLSGLSSLNEVTGTLFISKTEGLDEEDNAIPGSLEGLENISSVRSLLIGRPVDFGGSVHRYESLDPLNGLSGNVDSLFIETLHPDSELPPFENVTGIGYYRQELLLGVTSTPTFPNLTYLGDMTIAGGNGLFFEDVILTTVVIPSQLDSIATVQGEFNFPFGGIFIFGNINVLEVIGGENLTYIQNVSINSSPELSDISAFDSVTEVGGGLFLSSCNPEFFNSFFNLESVGVPNPVNLTFAGDDDCEGETFDTINFGISSNLADDNEASFDLTIVANQVNSVTVSGNFKNLRSLRVEADVANEITGFGSLDSITNGELRFVTPGISQLPNFENLVHVEGAVDFRINAPGWQLEDLTGLNSLNTVGGDLRLGGGSTEGGAFFGSLNGLESLTEVGWNIRIISLEALTDISALSNLVSAGSIRLDRLASLADANVFTNLQAMDGLVIDETNLVEMPDFSLLDGLSQNLTVRENALLESLGGLDNIVTIGGSVSIVNNALLTSVNIPDDVQFEGDLTISDNASLENCGSSSSICNLLSQATTAEITNNGNLCDGAEAVLAQCALSADDPEQQLDLTAFFNADALMIRSNQYQMNGRLDLFSAEGKRVFTQSATLQTGENRFQIPELTTGVYILSFENGEIFHRSKVFVSEP
ncbi:MAG: hypothetical protein WBG42_10970 [Cryomorphaceae bacterium]